LRRSGIATGARRQPKTEYPIVSTASEAPLFNRPDTMFGICEGIGREFGFHPNILRIALAIPLVWNPLAAIGLYLALGVALMVSRIVMPARNRATAKPSLAAVATSGVEPVEPAVALAA
jgi:phage shock protein PspC (stress-responsive transcriptional regulator)